MPSTFQSVVHKPKIPHIVAIVIGVVLSVPALFVLYYFMSGNLTRASDSEPRDVVISNVTSTQAKIVWTTDQEVEAVVEYGTAPDALVFYAPETKPTKDHMIELDLLTPRTTHYFAIRQGEKEYDNGGTPWTFTTKSATSSSDTLTPQPTQAPILFPTAPISSSSSVLPTAATGGTCNETSCIKIQQKFGQGCTVSDYVRCINSITPTVTPTPGVTTPTLTPTPSVVKADLVVLSASSKVCVSSDSPTATVQYSIAVKNQGNKQSGVNNLLIDFDRNSSTTTEEIVKTISTPIDPGNTLVIQGSLTMTNCTQCKAGTNSKNTVDKDAQIDESDENNNSTDITVITGTTCI